MFYFSTVALPRYLPSFPTRRSSDLQRRLLAGRHGREAVRLRWSARDDVQFHLRAPVGGPAERRPKMKLDRKSTRLNSSHANSSYAVFCLKKKKQITADTTC